MMKRRQFLTLLAAGASLAVPTKGRSSSLDKPAPSPSEEPDTLTDKSKPVVSAIENIQQMPTQILDLHSHMFNLRYLPMEGIIDDMLGTRNNLFALLVAQLLYRMTGSSYETPQDRQDSIRKRKATGQYEDPDLVDEYYINEIGEMAKYELLLTTHSRERLKEGLEPTSKMNQPKNDYPGLMNSDLLDIVMQLEQVKYKKEWEAVIQNSKFSSPPTISLNEARGIGDVFDAAGYIVKRALWIITKLVLPKLWSEEVDSYAEFLFALLASEDRIIDRFSRGYGNALPPIRTVHYMMDMQMAFADKRPAYYGFPAVQLDRMQTLQRRHPGTLLGFSAFDPRRPNWKKVVSESRKKGFIGFKFYPAMGYRPSGDKNYQKTISEFFAWCALEQVPIFAHCTPVGFETSKREGANAHPKYWREVLREWPDLRLCLGHAGGGRMGTSAGWLAKDKGEWKSDSNFAYIVATLCKTYPNVYCEMAYITELLEKKETEENRRIILGNIERAREINGEYDFMTKMAYGSDWHMPEMITHSRKYLDAWLGIFSRPAYEGYREHFFWKNGYTYLKLEG